MVTSFRLSERGFTLVEAARERKGWNAQDFKWTTDADVACATLRRFRARKNVKSENFINLCEAVGVNWQEAVEQNSNGNGYQKPSFFAYDDFWVGREASVSKLLDKLNDSCRLLMLVGMTGIGKTALAECLASRLIEDWLQDDWSRFLQENFEDKGKTPDFLSVAVRWLEKWGEKIAPEETQNIEALISRVVSRLETHRYLVILDSVENILQGNEEEGWSEFQDRAWVRFFEKLLALEACESRVILTSQDTPGQIEARYRNFWECQCVAGLTASERLALFEKTGLDVAEESGNTPYLTRIGAAYEGHPLALRLIAGEIGSNPFYGNVEAYWNRYGKEIEEVEKAIAEAKQGNLTGEDNWRLHDFNRQLRQGVKKRLEKTFERLKAELMNGYRLLCEASVYRCAVQEDFWLTHLQFRGLDEEAQVSALQGLKDRFLVEELLEGNQLMVRQHNLVRSLALAHLKGWEN
ncbi:MAG: ATP-binding protein [Cyanobacteriota bacterium]